MKTRVIYILFSSKASHENSPQLDIIIPDNAYNPTFHNYLHGMQTLSYQRVYCKLYLRSFALTTKNCDQINYVSKIFSQKKTMSKTEISHRNTKSLVHVLFISTFIYDQKEKGINCLKPNSFKCFLFLCRT